MELLSPAGNVDKLRYCYTYGADAAYIGLKNFSLRVKADNFYGDEYEQVAALKHQFPGRKLYCALNISFHNDELDSFVADIPYFKRYPIDAFIVQDLGVVPILQREFPDAALHLSTQASCINREAAKMYKAMGFSRVVLGREASVREIAEIKDAVPGLELECFVHGAMCIAYSGRCLLSAYVNGRSGQSGFCSHSCRWDYDVMADRNALPEPDGKAPGGETQSSIPRGTTAPEQDAYSPQARALAQSGALALREHERPDEYFPVYEGDNFTAVLSSKDLCMIDHLADLRAAGVDSLKIEGRMKSVYYVALVTRAYRKALDALEGRLSDAEAQPFVEELYKVSHRPFTTAFYYSRTEADKTVRAAADSPWLLAAEVGAELTETEAADIFARADSLRQQRAEEYAALVPEAQAAYQERVQRQPDRFLPPVQPVPGWKLFLLLPLNMIDGTTELELITPEVVAEPIRHTDFQLLNPATGEVYRWCCHGHPCAIYTALPLRSGALLRSRRK